MFSIFRVVWPSPQSRLEHFHLPKKKPIPFSCSPPLTTSSPLCVVDRPGRAHRVGATHRLPVGVCFPRGALCLTGASWLSRVLELYGAGAPVGQGPSRAPVVVSSADLQVPVSVRLCVHCSGALAWGRLLGHRGCSGFTPSSVPLSRG